MLGQEIQLGRVVDIGVGMELLQIEADEVWKGAVVLEISVRPSTALETGSRSFRRLIGGQRTQADIVPASSITAMRINNCRAGEGRALINRVLIIGGLTRMSPATLALANLPNHARAS